jgi:hypothetical protein
MTAAHGGESGLGCVTARAQFCLRSRREGVRLVAVRADLTTRVCAVVGGCDRLMTARAGARLRRAIARMGHMATDARFLARVDGGHVAMTVPAGAGCLGRRMRRVAARAIGVAFGEGAHQGGLLAVAVDADGRAERHEIVRLVTCHTGVVAGGFGSGRLLVAA